MATVQTSFRPSGLVDLWSVRLPQALDKLSSRLGGVFADGAWTMAWPRAGGWAPLAALGVGLLAPFTVHRVYTESLLFMVLLVAGAILSGPVGAMMLAGYMVGDLVFGGDRRLTAYFSLGADTMLRRGGSQIVSYILLSIPALLVPGLARRMVRQFRLETWKDPGARLLARVALSAAACGLLIFLWCQGMVVLVRPIFTWLRSSPTTEAVRPVQHFWQYMVGAAAMAAAVRVILEHQVRSGPFGAALAELRRQRRARLGTSQKPLPAIVRIALSTGIVTAILSGTYESSLDAVVVAAATAALGAWHAGWILGGPPAGWAATARRIPLLFRFAAAPLAGYIVSNLILQIFWRTGSLRPVMIGSLLTVALFYFAFPPAGRGKVLPGQARRAP